MKAIPWDGKPISKPGLYSGIPLAAYHSAKICIGQSVSSSGLREIDIDNGGSPAHFYAKWPGNPKRIDEGEKKHFTLGRAVHHLLLKDLKSPEGSFSEAFIVQPEEYPDRKLTKLTQPSAVQAWLEAQQEQNQPTDWVMREWHHARLECKAWLDEQVKLGKSVLKMSEVEDIKGMALGLARLPIVTGKHSKQHGVLNGQIERSIFWRDKKTGIWLKSRPDAIPSGTGLFADLKTTTSVQRLDLMKAITDFKYHQQAALVRSAAVEVLKIPKENFSFVLVFVEKSPPYCACTVQLKPQHIDLGERLNRKAIDLMASCLESGEWPGPGEYDDAPWIDLQEYYTNRIAQRLEEYDRETRAR